MSQQQQTKPAVIIDCDPGHDDVMAILLGGRTLDVRGLTQSSATSTWTEDAARAPDLEFAS